MIYSRIEGTGRYLPERILTNADLEKIVETSDEWIRTRTGIEQRHVASDDDMTSDLCVRAAHNAMEAAGVSVDEIDMVFVGTAAESYQPFGQPMLNSGSTQVGYGFTGEWMDLTGLVYLRARYYEPYLNQWIQPDPIVPDPYIPADWNRYAYVRNNPVNLTDPSGLSPLIPPEPPNHRDLTYWLYNELHTNANSYYAQRIKSLLSSPFPISNERAMAGWIFLVKDKAKWDFKHKIEDELLGQTILLRHDTGYRWYEYSIPGNIHFGYVGRAAGFSGLALHLGAGYAEVTDPAHSDRGEACCPQVCRVGVTGNIPYALCVRLGCYYFNPDWALTLFDDPQDWQTVEFGVKLYDTYRENLTFDQFQSFLASHGNQLTPAAEIPEWNWVNPGGWPYNLGRFRWAGYWTKPEMGRFAFRSSW